MSSPSSPAARINWTAAALLSLALALVGYQSVANRLAGAKAPPVAIAAFDLEKTFNALEEKKAADADLLKLAEEMNAKGQEQSKAIKEMKEDLEVHQQGSAKYLELSEKIGRETMSYQAYIEFCRGKIDEEHGRILRRLYLKIRKAAQEIAEEQGYAVVFVNDSLADLQLAGQDEMSRQISARRMVYVSPEIDISQEIVSRMNQTYQPAAAQKSTPPAPSPKPATTPNKPVKKP